jgi:xeroderma pigmentosum group C-complementing protein
MFETAMGHLTFWWAQTFFDVTFDGHLRNRTFDAVQRTMDLHELPDATESWDVELLQEVLDEKGELIRGPKSLMKHALMQRGSRDISAQLFTALCRGLGIPARLVVSLQSVPWQSNVGKPKPNYYKGKGKAKAEEPEVTRDVKGKGKAKAKADSSAFLGDGQRLDGGSVPEKSEKAKGKEKAKPVIKLRNTKSQGNVLGTSLASSSTSVSQIGTYRVIFQSMHTES